MGSQPKEGAGIGMGQWLVFLAVALITMIGVVLNLFARDFLVDVYLIEDGIMEWMTVALLLCLLVLCVKRAVTLRSLRPKTFFIASLVLAVGFFFVIGEELSWGQRLFAVEAPDWVIENNQQGDITLHNMMIGDFSVNHVIFGNLLT